jgi:hypothetical protein
MQPYHALAARASFRDSQFISKINGKRFCLSGPLDLVGLACGMVAAPQNCSQSPLPDDRMLNASRFRADEDNLELLLDDDLIVDARQQIIRRIIAERIGRTVVAGSA